VELYCKVLGQNNLLVLKIIVLYDFFFRKSTIIRLLFRFFEPTSGEILIGGKNINNVDIDSLRKCMAIVPQVTTC